MKTVVLKIYVIGLFSSEGTGYVDTSGHTYKIEKNPLTQQQIDKFRLTIPGRKEEMYSLMKKRFLPAGGFIYGGDLYQWKELLENPYTYILYAYVTFQDTDNVGKKEFMKMIDRTRLIQDTESAEIYKSYS